MQFTPRVKRALLAGAGSAVELVAASVASGRLPTPLSPAASIGAGVLIALLGVGLLARATLGLGRPAEGQRTARPRSGRTAIRMAGGEGNVVEGNTFGPGYDSDVDAVDEKDLTVRRNRFN